MIDVEESIYIAGHRGMVGSAFCRKLDSMGYKKVIARTHNELNLTRQSEVEDLFRQERPDYVVLAAARVGGIGANSTRPADFIYDNLMMESNVIHAAYGAGVKQLLFLGSSCIYPRITPQPMTEDALLTGLPEPTNEPYAIAKIAGIKLCESYNRQYNTDYRSVMPTNLYGPGDNFEGYDSHVIPALMRKFHEAKQTNAASVEIWGSGEQKREFLHVDDMVDACWHVMNLTTEAYREKTDERISHINVGTGVDVKILELAEMIQNIVGFEGKLAFDTSKPDGPPRKLLNIDRIKSLGWHPSIELEQGLSDTYAWFVEHAEEVRGMQTA